MWFASMATSNLSTDPGSEEATRHVVRLNGHQ
jgi:hypothetical protein